MLRRPRGPVGVCLLLAVCCLLFNNITGSRDKSQLSVVSLLSGLAEIDWILGSGIGLYIGAVEKQENVPN
jgi:hypothetical protein